MNTPTHTSSRKTVSQGQSLPNATLLGPHTVDAAFEDQSFIVPCADSEGTENSADTRPLLGNFAKQLSALKEQEARLRDLLRTSRKR